MLLGYMEGQPLYNAANFNWVCCWSSGWAINSTATLAIVNTFICPSDGLSPVPTQNDIWTGATNNYFASVGDSTDFYNPSGMFAESTQCYGLQSCTDGSSNTIAFGEALVGSQGAQQVKYRSGPVLGAGSALCTGGWCGITDVSTKYAAVLADLQTCQQGWVTETTSFNGKGFRWCENLGGFTLFNTVVPPSPNDYKFGWCALRGGGTNSNASDGQYQNANSNHPGGANFLLSDGSARFIKSSVNIKTYWARETGTSARLSPPTSIDRTIVPRPLSTRWPCYRRRFIGAGFEPLEVVETPAIVCAGSGRSPARGRSTPIASVMAKLLALRG